MQKILEGLKNKANPERYNAIFALAPFGDLALDHLHAALSDEDKWVRYFAADALGDLKNSRSVDPLVLRLLDQDQDVRYVAASALGRIGDPRAAHALMQAYNSDNCFVRIFIEEALDNLGRPTIVPEGTVTSRM